MYLNFFMCSDYKFLNFKFRFVISNPQKSLVTNSIVIKQLFAFWSAIFDPSFLISICQVQIRNWRPQKTI